MERATASDDSDAFLVGCYFTPSLIFARLSPAPSFLSTEIRGDTATLLPRYTSTRIISYVPCSVLGTSASTIQPIAARCSNGHPPFPLPPYTGFQCVVDGVCVAFRIRIGSGRLISLGTNGSWVSPLLLLLFGMFWHAGLVCGRNVVRNVW